MSGPEEVTLGDKRVEILSVDRYKGRKNIVDRVGIISSSLIRRLTFFHEGASKKTTFIAPENPQTLELVKKQLGEPVQKFGLLLFHYVTDDKGALFDDTKLKGKIKAWPISETRYEELSGIHGKWPLMDAGFDQKSYDLEIKCTEEQFQRMSFTPCPESHWKKKQEWYKYIKDREPKAREYLLRAIGRKMTDAEILELLGAAIPSQTGGSDRAGDIDISDITGDGTVEVTKPVPTPTENDGIDV